jgi:hypothetical protein
VVLEKRDNERRSVDEPKACSLNRLERFEQRRIEAGEAVGEFWCKTRELATTLRSRAAIWA